MLVHDVLGERSLAAAVRVHDVDVVLRELRVSTADVLSSRESDLAPVRRPRRVGGRGPVRQPSCLRAVAANDADRVPGVLGLLTAVGDELAARGLGLVSEGGGAPGRRYRR